MNYLLSDEPFDDEKYKAMIYGGVKASADDVIGSIKGYEILPEQKFKMNHARSHMDFIFGFINETEQECFATAARTTGKSSTLQPCRALQNCLRFLSFQKSVRTCPPLIR